MLNKLQLLKIKIMCQGIKIAERVKLSLTQGGKIPLSLFEYPTISGLSLILPDDIYVNAQFSGKFVDSKIINIAYPMLASKQLSKLYHYRNILTKGIRTAFFIVNLLCHIPIG